MKLIDTHAHLNLDSFKKDWLQIIRKCQKLDLGIINVAIDMETSKKALQISQKFKNTFSALGIHPLTKIKKFPFKTFLNLAQSKKVVALGEIGLDYFRAQDKESQKALLKKQLKLAQLLKLPVIFHCRQAYDDLLKILKEKNFRNLKGVIHCFCGDIKIAKEFLNLGFYLGFNGLITYSNQYQNLVKKIPLKRILLETDCPYLTPFPFKKKRNDPTYLFLIAKKISELKQVSFSTLAKITTFNAKKLFKL